MLPQQRNSLLYKKHSITILLGVVVLCFFISCGGRKASLGEAITDRDSLPMMTTLGGETFFSDSGYFRFRLVYESCEIFDKKNPSYWAFEHGCYLERLDTVLFNKEVSIQADTAYFFDKKGLWELIGNVHAVNSLGEKFDTELLYWDEAAGRVYTDRFIRIEQIDRHITGYGFESNRQMTVYSITDITGIFYIEDTGGMPVQTDSIP